MIEVLVFWLAVGSFQALFYVWDYWISFNKDDLIAAVVMFVLGPSVVLPAMCYKTYKAYQAYKKPHYHKTPTCSVCGEDMDDPEGCYQSHINSRTVGPCKS